jgi:SAM-dependent methyltransferase
MPLDVTQVATSIDRFLAASGEAPPPVSVVITCYNQGRFLGEAIESVLRQTYRRHEVVVIDDGSSDDTADVAARYSEVGLVIEPHRGLAAARNAGIRYSSGDYLVFLDADDRLLPSALEVGVKHLSANPQAAFVSGRHVRIAAGGAILSSPHEPAVHGDHYLALLRGNYIGMHAAVMYRREALEAVEGFDSSLPRCEDYDLFLRLARRFSVSSHDEPVAEYRFHGANMSSDSAAMLGTVLRVLRSEARRAPFDDDRRRAYRAGIAAWQAYYGAELIRDLRARLRDGRELRHALSAALALVRHSPRWLLGRSMRGVRRASANRASRILPDRVKRRLALLMGRRPHPGRVRWGDLRRLTPISRRFGYERGLPIDRYYIERFLASRSGDIHGRVLEVGDRAYTSRFGGERVTQSDVLHVSTGNPLATLVADLARADHIPRNSFDCVVLTQTLHLVYDVRAATATLHRILKPGGVLLATVPGLSQLEDGEWANTWYWSFTSRSASRIFSEVFADVEVRTRGNVLGATAFLQGIAAEELAEAELEHNDPLYQLLITIRAVKAVERK